MRILLVLIAAATGTSHAAAWGFVAHRIVAENSVAALPDPMAGFYKANITAVSDASIEPDTLLRERDGEQEKRRHYIDLDALTRPPFHDLPFDEQEARRLYGSRRVDEAGVLPWRIVGVHAQLREAFREEDPAKIISRSGWLSHYVADAYQPLHTTKNFDGQQTCNRGVHAVFETDLIDRLKARYRRETALPESFAPAVIEETGRFLFSEIFSSYGLVEMILRADTESMDLVKKQRKDYFEEMERQLGSLARSQMRRAEATTVSLWYSAWVESGRPGLPGYPLPRPPREGRP